MEIGENSDILFIFQMVISRICWITCLSNSWCSYLEVLGRLVDCPVC